MRADLQKGFGLLIVMVCVGWVFRVGLVGPDHSGFNWDMIGYVASLYKQDGFSGEKLSNAVFSDVEKEVGSSDLAKLTDGASECRQVPCPGAKSYRWTVYADPVSLEQNVPFYSIRIIYLASVRALSNFVHSYSRASILCSAVFASLCVFSIALILDNFRISQLYLPVIVFVSGLSALARISSPDALACLLSLLCGYALLKRSRLAFLLIIVLPLARTDFVILSLLFSICSFCLLSHWMSVCAVLISVVLMFVDNQMNDHYGFVRIFNFALININPYPAEMANSTNISDYFRAYISGASETLNSRNFLVYLFTVLFFALDIFRRRVLRDMDWLLLSSLGFVVFHLILFPHYLERFFVFPVIVSTIFLIGRMSEGVIFRRDSDRLEVA